MRERIGEGGVVGEVKEMMMALLRACGCPLVADVYVINVINSYDCSSPLVASPTTSSSPRLSSRRLSHYTPTLFSFSDRISCRFSKVGLREKPGGRCMPDSLSSRYSPSVCEGAEEGGEERAEGGLRSFEAC